MPKRKRKNIIGLFIGGIIGGMVAGILFWYFNLPTDQDNGSQASNGSGTSDVNLALPQTEDKDWTKIDDATQDGWDTEVFNEKAGKQFKKLGNLVTGSSPITADDFDSLLASEFQSTTLMPGNLSEVFKDTVMEVQRAESIEAGSGEIAYNNKNDFRNALVELAEPLKDATDARSKFKIFRIKPADSTVETHQLVSFSGLTPTGIVEINSTWRATWNKADSADDYPTIASIECLEYENVTTQGKQPLFVEYTESALENDPSYESQILRSYNHWLNRTEIRPFLALLGTPGIAIADVNGDGLDDIYVCQETRIPNLLYLQNPDGSISNAAAESGVDWLADSRGALLIDLDNDGDQDLAVAVSGGLIVAENDGAGKFTTRDVLPASDDIKSICAADFDRDGKVDLYTTVYQPDLFATGEENVGTVAAADQTLYDTNRGGPNNLFRNEIADGEWIFTNVTRDVGLDENNRRYGLAAAFEDFDNDGDEDLYVANDYGRNNFYRNDGGTFKDIAAELDVEDFNFAMSVTWSDIDHDQNMDLYVANMFSGAGNRITFQESFKPGASGEAVKRFQHMARGNTMYQNDGEGGFNDISDGTGVSMGRWAWSSHFVDLNNDGWDDIVVANGFITTEDTGDC